MSRNKLKLAQSKVHFLLLLSMDKSQVPLHLECKCVSHMFNRKLLFRQIQCMDKKKLFSIGGWYAYVIFVGVMLRTIFVWSIHWIKLISHTHTRAHTSYTSNHSDMWTQHIFPPFLFQKWLLFKNVIETCLVERFLWFFHSFASIAILVNKE